MTSPPNVEHARWNLARPPCHARLSRFATKLRNRSGLAEGLQAVAYPLECVAPHDAA